MNVTPVSDAVERPNVLRYIYDVVVYVGIIICACLFVVIRVIFSLLS